MIIDAHVHLNAKDREYVGKLLRKCDELGIDKVCLIGPPRDIFRAKAEAPDRILSLAMIRLGYDPETIVDDIASEESDGLKVIRPRFPYDDERAYPYYARAEDHGLPILFHLGIVARRPQDRAWRTNSNFMRPIHLDHIARCFPALKIIGAHLGNPWYEEASMSARWNQNLWFDLSGSTLKKKTPEFIRRLFWWDREGHPYKPHGGKHPWEKIVFGTDVAIEWMEDVMNDYKNLCDHLSIDKPYRDKIFGLNAAEVFGVE